tara:strand:+ start:609 stop:1124 length:516 start_codon:yes stop_codon:yes gene_type:complete
MKKFILVMVSLCVTVYLQAQSPTGLLRSNFDIQMSNKDDLTPTSVFFGDGNEISFVNKQLGCLDQNAEITFLFERNNELSFSKEAFGCMVISTQEFVSKNKRTWFALKEFEIIGIKIWTGEILFSYYEDDKELYTAIKHHMMKGKLPKSWLRENQDVLDPNYWLINSGLSK